MSWIVWPENTLVKREKVEVMTSSDFNNFRSSLVRINVHWACSCRIASQSFTKRRQTPKTKRSYMQRRFGRKLYMSCSSSSALELNTYPVRKQLLMTSASGWCACLGGGRHVSGRFAMNIKMICEEFGMEHIQPQPYKHVVSS